MAFSGGGGNKPFSPFTITASQAPVPLTQSASAPFAFGSTTGGFGFGTGGVSSAAGSAPPANISFGTPAPAAQPSSLFSLGASSATGAAAPAGGAPATGAPTFNFGLNTGASSLGLTPAVTSTPSLGTAFGVSSTPSALSFGAPTTQSGLSFGTTTSQSGLSFGAPTTQSGLSFGTPATQSGLSFGSVTSTQPPPSFAAATATGTAQPQPAAAAPVAPSFLSVTPSTTTTPSVLPTFGLTATTQAPTSLPLGGLSTATTSAPPFQLSSGTGSLNLTTPVKPLTSATTTVTTAATPALGTTGALASAAPQLTTATTTTQSSTASVSQMNFRQLQEAINKWMVDLQEQEKVFLEQATKVNAWDRTLIMNGEKIAKLNESVTKVKSDHNRLEHALEYLKTQQQEFEMFLEPLEASLPVNIPAEPEREHLYGLTENVDTQLQQMAEDLKEVIRHINESNKTVDKNDPVSQILRILNEHTDALQWVEDNANSVRKSLDDISKQHHLAKKEHERSLRTMFK